MEAVDATAKVLLYSWGRGDEGQLGHGYSDIHMRLPHVVSSSAAFPSIAQIAVGDRFSLARTMDGSILAWGRIRNVHSDVPLPRNINCASEQKFRHICASGSCAVAITNHGDAILLNDDEATGVDVEEEELYGEQIRWEGERVFFRSAECFPPKILLVGDTGEVFLWNKEKRNATRVMMGVGGPLICKQCAAGHFHNVFVAKDGTPFTSGSSTQGALGRTSGIRSEEIAVDVQSLRTVGRILSVAAGFSHSLFCNEYGQVFACGDNSHGQLGTRQTSSKRPLPTRVNISSLSTGDKVVAVAAGDFTSFCVTSHGNLYSFGMSTCGQLGIAFPQDSKQTSKSFVTPRQVRALTGHPVIQVAAGKYHTLALVLTTSSAEDVTVSRGEVKQFSVQTLREAQFQLTHKREDNLRRSLSPHPRYRSANRRASYSSIDTYQSTDFDASQSLAVSPLGGSGKLATKKKFRDDESVERLEPVSLPPMSMGGCSDASSLAGILSTEEKPRGPPDSLHQPDTGKSSDVSLGSGVQVDRVVRQAYVGGFNDLVGSSVSRGGMSHMTRKLSGGKNIGIQAFPGRKLPRGRGRARFVGAGFVFRGRHRK